MTQEAYVGKNADTDELAIQPIHALALTRGGLEGREKEHESVL